MFKYRSLIRSLSKLETGKPPFLMIASLGNPEKHYKGTRHNAGHWITNKIHENWNTQVFSDVSKNEGKLSIDLSRSNILLYQTTGYMNLSGAAVGQAWNKILNMKKSQFSPALVVIHDELSLPLGKVQIRKQKSSHRGHNGLKSVEVHAGPDFTRIAIGIGRPDSRDPKVVAEYVLSKFDDEEAQVMDYEITPKVEEIIEEMRLGKYIYDVNNKGIV